jgi:Ser/Thr protein kinase RdoA (MazF antagonist)
MHHTSKHGGIMVIDLSIYRERLQLEHATFTRIEHEDALAAIVYKVAIKDGTTLILKICLSAQHYGRELYCLNYLAGQLPVPKLIDHVPPSQEVYGAVLMECQPGHVIKKEELTGPLAFHMGSLLAKIHLNRAPAYGDLANTSALDTRPHEPFISQFLKYLAESKSHLTQNQITLCEKYLHDHLSLLDSVEGPCLTHGDFRPGNIIACNGAIQGVIDWAASRAEFAEQDFCSLEFHHWADSGIKASFVEGYTSMRPVPAYGEIMPLLLLSKALASIGWTIRTKTWDNKGAEFYKLNRSFINHLLADY